MQDPNPSDYAPPLTWWGHTWRIVAALLISGVVWVQVGQIQWQHHRALFWLDGGLGLASFVMLQLRRRWPLPIALLLNLAGLFSASSAGPALVATVSLATRRVVWQVVAVGLVAMGASIGFNAMQPVANAPSWWLELTVATAFTVASLAVGMYIGSRRELLWTLRDRAQQAEEQQELRVESARAAERERIAREMHDVLAHRISMVSMHAGALAYRTDLPPEQVRETAALIQTKAHEALSDLRQVLGVLRDDPTTRDRPQPTLRDLPELVAEARTSGMDVDLDLAVADDAPEQVARATYRIVQEGLTNARKHALGTRVQVQVAGDADGGIDIWVRNPIRVGAAVRAGRTPGAGLGLVGLRERAELVGGTIEIADDRDGFALHGWLPWQG